MIVVVAQQQTARGRPFLAAPGQLEKVEEEIEDAGPASGQGNASLLLLGHVIFSEKHVKLLLVDGLGGPISFEQLEPAVQRHDYSVLELCSALTERRRVSHIVSLPTGGALRSITC